MEFNKKNLVEFETEFYRGRDSKYFGQRYGQALENVFDFHLTFPNMPDLFYEKDASYAREIAWQALYFYTENPF